MQGYEIRRIRDGDRDAVVGVFNYFVENSFALLRHHQIAEAFRRAGEITYFILPEHGRRGLGTRFMDIVAADARAASIETLLANISSLNEASLNFHLKHGFKKCGLFERIGQKFGKDFDVIWMQKFL